MPQWLFLFMLVPAHLCAQAISSADTFALMEGLFSTYLVNPLSQLIFFNVLWFMPGVNFPLILLWLIGGALFLTIKMRFINVRGFSHAILVTRGVYDNRKDPGEISHFQALASALSATVGLGNIAGVALAVTMGGPGAVFWLVVAGCLGMTSKFVECSLAVKYRTIDAQGHVLGGPMRYLVLGLKNKGLPRLGHWLSILFCILCIGGSLGGGNMFQANQAYAAMASSFPLLQGKAWIFGLLISSLVGVVIIGGIKRIGSAASFIVPFMCFLYIASCLWILFVHRDMVPDALLEIWRGAFTPKAQFGGFLGVLIVGFRRACFSNEAGVGSAAIAHSAAATNEPIREGIVALLEPFIDTVVICTLTGLTIVVTKAYQATSGDGVLVAGQAFKTVGEDMPKLLAIAVLLFAYSTMISWSYYGERCWAHMFKTNNTLAYKVLFIACTFLGSVFSLGPVLEFSDLMILGMAFPNMMGIVILSSEVKSDLAKYWLRYGAGGVKAPSLRPECRQ